MTDKVKDRSSLSRERTRVSNRALPKGPIIEVSAETPSGDDLDRERADSVLSRIEDLRPVGRNDGEWISNDGRLRVLVGDVRILLRFEMRDEGDDELARNVDRTFDVAFELGKDLGLDVADADLGAITRYRYESHFARILDSYRARARTAFTLQRADAWRELSKESEPVILPSSVQAFETDPESLPPAVWSRRVRRVGPLELHGEQALAVLAAVTPDSPWFGIMRPHAASGDDVALLRVMRLSTPSATTVVVEAIAAGLTRSSAIQREGASFRVAF